MNRTLFSVIVPFYNSQDYLEECILSVLNQDCDSFELILVDDGSTDNSYLICKKYLPDNRIKYFKKNNGGVCSARNYGIIKSTGEYIVFLDSDDYLEKNALSSYEKIIIKEYDFVCSSFNVVTKRKTTSSFLPNKEYSKKDVSSCLYDLMFVISATVGKLFKSQLIKSNKIMFDDRFSYSEDTLFNLTYLQFCESFYTTNKITYNIRRTSKNSLSTRLLDNIEQVYGIQYDIFVSIIKNNPNSNDSFEQESYKYANKIAQTCINYYLCRFNQIKRMPLKIGFISSWIKEKKENFSFFYDSKLYFNKFYIFLLNKNHYTLFYVMWLIRHFPYVLKKIII